MALDGLTSLKTFFVTRILVRLVHWSIDKHWFIPTKKKKQTANMSDPLGPPALVAADIASGDVGSSCGSVVGTLGAPNSPSRCARSQTVRSPRTAKDQSYGLPICAMVKSRYIGDGHPTFNRNPYNGYTNPYYWVDDHPLLYGNNGSFDPGTYNAHIPEEMKVHVWSISRWEVHFWAFQGFWASLPTGTSSLRERGKIRGCLPYLCVVLRNQHGNG